MPVIKQLSVKFGVNVKLLVDMECLEEMYRYAEYAANGVRLGNRKVLCG